MEARKAVHWDLRPRDGKLFLCVNGREMVDDKGQELEIEQIGYGRSSAEAWLKFKNVKVGRNLEVKNFVPANDFSKEKLNGTSVTQLITSVSINCPWITRYRRKRPGTPNQAAEKKKKMERMMISEEDTEIEFSQKILPGIRFKDNFIGKFEVNVLILAEAPTQYMARKINYEWVNLLKHKILQQPRILTTVLPVLIDPEQVKDVQSFEPEKLSSYRLWTLGGNHIRSALQQIAKEAVLNDLRNVNIQLYCGLTAEEGRQLGNMHNGSQTSIKPTFQDCIDQAQQLVTKSGDDQNLALKVANMMNDIEMREVPKESVGTIVSVLRYSEDNMQTVKLIFQQYGHKHGTFKSIPQTLFRELQGVDDEKRSSFLEYAYQHGIEMGVKEVRRAKKRAKLEACFMKIVKCDNMEDCTQIYPDHVEQIDKYTELQMTGNCIPDVFVDFCKKAADSAEITESITSFNPFVNINIRLNNKDISNLDVVKKLTNKFKQKLLNQLMQNEINIVKSISSNKNTCSTEESSADVSLNFEDSGFPETSLLNSTLNSTLNHNITQISEDNSNEDEITESNMETQQQANQSQDLF